MLTIRASVKSWQPSRGPGNSNKIDTLLILQWRNLTRNSIYIFIYLFKYIYIYIYIHYIVLSQLLSRKLLSTHRWKRRFTQRQPTLGLPEGSCLCQPSFLWPFSVSCSGRSAKLWLPPGWRNAQSNMLQTDLCFDMDV